MCKVTLDYNKIEWSKYFSLDEQSPSGLIYKVSVGRKKAGDIAGIKSFDFRTKEPHMWRVRIFEKYFCVHRIIALLLDLPLDNTKVVDHKNGNPFDNRIENLEVKSQSENCQNRKLGKNSRTGVVGCSLGSNGTNRNYIVAFIKSPFDSTQISERFSIEDFGYDLALKLAKEWRENKIKESNSLGCKYTERHGT